MAFRMQFEAREAFDLGRESAVTRGLYGKGEFASACLIAPDSSNEVCVSSRSITVMISRGTIIRTSTTTATMPERAISQSPPCSET